MTYLILISFSGALLVMLYPYIRDSVKASVEATRELRRGGLLETSRDAERLGRARLNKMNKEYSWLLFKARERKALQLQRSRSSLRAVKPGKVRLAPYL